MEQLNTALRICKELENLELEQDFLLEYSIYMSFGEYYLRSKIYDRAMENFSECFQLTNRLPDHPSTEMFKLLCDIGLCEFQQECFKSAIESYRCAEAIFVKEKELFDDLQIFHVYRKIAEACAHKKIGDLQQALDYYRLAEKHITADTSIVEKAQLYGNIASCMLNLSSIDLSIEYNLKAIQEYTNDDAKRHSLEISRCYFKIGFANIKVKSSEPGQESSSSLGELG